MENKATKLFIVEDDLIIQFYIERVAQRNGCEVIGKARSFKEAMEFLRLNKPDLILLDIGLVGDKDGIETAEMINKEFQIPFIFMTGNSDKFTISRAESANPIGFIFKPMDEFGLIEKLTEFRKRIS